MNVLSRALALAGVWFAFASVSFADRGSMNPVLEQTSLVCEPLGLGAIESVPYNFPGADESVMNAYRPFLPGLVEIELPAGANPAVPRIFGGDLGAPFEHSDGRMYFTFGDLEPAPVSGLEPTFCEGAVCAPRVVNNDLLATSTQVTAPTPTGCLQLTIEGAASDPLQFVPITNNGAYLEGGANLGGGVVPGPAFSTGKYVFMLAPSGKDLRCAMRETDNTCPDAGGIEGDHCFLVFGPNEGTCYFGECANSLESPCALRYPPATLSVREHGSRFESPEIGVHIASAEVLGAYRGHFATASFFSQVDFATNDGRVWVVGRDAFWSPPGLEMDPYLMFHEVTDGQLGEAQYFAGVHDGAAVFSRDRRDAQPIFEEDKLVHNHTSIAYLPEFAGGAWVMLYGGRAQVSIRDALAFFVRPVADELFYDPEAGVYLRWAKQPWGPWSDAITIFNAMTPGQGGYCESMYFEDPEGRMDFECPEDKVALNQRLDRQLISSGLAAEYGVAIVPRFTRSFHRDRSIELYWLMSTWNPYRVVLMQTRLQFQRSAYR